MFVSTLVAINKHYRILRNLAVTHPLFSTFDKYKLDQINRKTNEKGYVHLKPKGWKHAVKIRKNFVDKDVVFYVLQDQYHLPPKQALLRDNPVILDLGSNIGLTVAHMKKKYPTAKIIGYEMNQENYLLAKANTKSYQNVNIINAAVWIEDGTVSYTNAAHFDSYSLLQPTEINSVSQTIEVPSLKLTTIIQNHNLDYIDYLKMDIEGAEVAILESSDVSWMDRVFSMNIEMHLDKDNDLNTYIAILEKKGFIAWKDTKHWSSIFAVRKSDM